MLFNGWDMLARTLIIGFFSYAALIILLRASGKRTLSKMNAFDFVVTVALGSTLATMLLSKDVALAQGALAFALLISLQFIVTWLSVRSKGVARIVKSEPTLLYYRGQMLYSAMKKERVLEDEILSALRSHGHLALADVEAVVLETDGTMSVTPKADTRGGRDSLENLTTSEQPSQAMSDQG